MTNPTPQTHSGHCLCGAVSFQVSLESLPATACHCDMCRRWTGGPYFGVFSGADIRYGGEECISVYQSSQWAERGFCKTCGSNLFYRLRDSGITSLAAGCFDDQTEIALRREYFIDRKPDIYTLDTDVAKLTGEEVFALYAPAADD